MNPTLLLLDVETQRDLFQSGYLAKHPEGAANRVVRLFSWARRNHIPVISTVLRLRRTDRGPFGNKPHCIEGTEGEQKLPGTILPRRINLGLLNVTDLPRGLLERYQQVIFEKRHTDILKHARAERFFTELGPATFVICGAGVAQGIVEAAVGLRSRGFGVVLARDAVLDFDHPLAPMAYRRMEAKGVIFADAREIIEPQPVERGAPFRPVRSLVCK